MSDETLPRVPDHLQPFLDSVLVDQLAQALLNVACASKAEPPMAFMDLAPADRERMRYLATLTYRHLNPQALSVAEWRAAEAVGQQLYGRDFEDLKEHEHRLSKMLAQTAIVAYELHLKGFTPVHEETRTVGLIERLRRKFAIRNAERAQRRADQATYHRTLCTASQIGTPWPPTVVPFVRPGSEVLR